MMPYRLIHPMETAREAADIATRHSQHEITALRLYQPPHIGELADLGTHASKIQPVIPK